jgi:predicted transcriptional regulator
MAKQPPRPTESELKVLAVLWRDGPSTVRHVHGRFEKGTGYTTVLKFMQLMAEKGLLLRERAGKQHVYRPAIAQEQTQRGLIRDMLDRAFGGSVRKLLVAALAAERTSPEELAAIRALIDQIESRQTKGGKS